MIEVLDIALDLAFDAGGIELLRLACVRGRYLAGRGFAAVAGLAMVGADRMVGEMDARARRRMDVELRRMLARA